MIVANIKDAERYYAVNPDFRAVFEFLKTLNTESTEGVVSDDYRVNFSGKYIETADKNPDGTEFSATAGGNKSSPGYFNTSREAAVDSGPAL